MELSKAIEQYVEREVDFFNEVTLMQDGTHDNKPYIHTWNITEKTKPTITQLESVYDENALTSREVEKLTKKAMSLQGKILSKKELKIDYIEEKSKLDKIKVKLGI